MGTHMPVHRPQPAERPVVRGAPAGYAPLAALCFLVGGLAAACIPAADPTNRPCLDGVCPAGLQCSANRVCIKSLRPPLASDGGVGACVDRVGAPCERNGYCGATIDCDGTCIGGVPAPACECGEPTCTDGQWTECSDPADLNAPCDEGGCGGRRACDGSCQGTTALPVCDGCRVPSCNADGSGAPGCEGADCSDRSRCVSGSCVCEVDECDCGGVVGTTCSQCVDGKATTCEVDTVGCGRIVSATDCPYGCNGEATECACPAPADRQSCNTNTLCDCDCPIRGRIQVPPRGLLNCEGQCEAAFACEIECIRPCGCDCQAGVDNFCTYGIEPSGGRSNPRWDPDCAMLQSGGYCDPNGDRSFEDGDWQRGFLEFRYVCDP